MSLVFKKINKYNLREKVLQDEAKDVILNEEGVLRIRRCMREPHVDNLIHTGATKCTET